MKNKGVAVAFVFTLLFSAVSSLQFASLATANPVPYPPEPNTELPTLTVQTPCNHSNSYAENTVTFNFSVTKPDSWNHYWMFGFPVIGDYSVWVYLDEKQYSTYWDPRVPDQLTTDYSVVLYNLTSEPHNLRIDVRARTFYENPNKTEHSDYAEHFMNVSQAIHFTVIADQRMILFTVDEIGFIPELPSWTPMLIMLSVLAVAVVVYKRRVTKTVNSYDRR